MKVLAIIGKDIRQHRTLMSVFLFVGLVIPWLYLWIVGAHGDNQTISQLSAIGFSGATILPLCTPISVANWLMSSERTKRTLLVLRMLPISSDMVIGSKEAVLIAYAALMTFASVVSYGFAFHYKLGCFPILPPFPHMVILISNIVMLGEATLWLLLRFEQKWALQLPGVVAILLWNAPSLVSKLPWSSRSRSVTEIAWATAALCVAFFFLMHTVMVREFDRQDWAMPSLE